MLPSFAHPSPSSCSIVNCLHGFCSTNPFSTLHTHLHSLASFLFAGGCIPRSYPPQSKLLEWKAGPLHDFAVAPSGPFNGRMALFAACTIALVGIKSCTPPTSIRHEGYDFTCCWHGSWMGITFLLQGDCAIHPRDILMYSSSPVITDEVLEKDHLDNQLDVTPTQETENLTDQEEDGMEEEGMKVRTSGKKRCRLGQVAVVKKEFEDTMKQLIKFFSNMDEDRSRHQHDLYEITCEEFEQSVQVETQNNTALF